MKKRGGKETFTSSLEHAAKQFVMHQKYTADIIAGFPWYNSIRNNFV